MYSSSSGGSSSKLHCTLREKYLTSLVNKSFHAIIDDEQRWKTRVLEFFSRKQGIPKDVNINWKRLCYLIDPDRNRFSNKFAGHDIVYENERKTISRANKAECRMNQNAFIEHPFRFFAKKSGDEFMYVDFIINKHVANKISIGLAEKSFNMNSGFVGFPSLLRKKTSMGYTSDGWLRTGELCNRVVAPAFSQDDHVGLMVKKKKNQVPEMLMWVNGIAGPSAPMLQLKKLDTYYPCLTLYHPEDKVEICDKIQMPLSVMLDLCQEFNVTKKNENMTEISSA